MTAPERMFLIVGAMAVTGVATVAGFGIPGAGLLAVDVGVVVESELINMLWEEIANG